MTRIGPDNERPKRGSAHGSHGCIFKQSTWFRGFLVQLVLAPLLQTATKLRQPKLINDEIPLVCIPSIKPSHKIL